MNSKNLIYALKDNKPISISDVESGLKCGCTCPSCGEALVAKKGKKMMHHFAHYSGQNCEYGYESSLHLAAKEILSQAKYITLPAVYVSFPNSYKKKVLYCEAKQFNIDNVELEKNVGSIIPDVVIQIQNRQIYLEIFATHPVDDIKLEKLKELDVSTIEIDLSKKSSSITLEELNNILLGDSEEKTWKYNSKEKKLLQKFYAVSDKREIIQRRAALHIDHCPRKIRTWRGKYYANFIDDCLYCPYCISGNYEGDILCSGRTKISSCEDFELPEEMRGKDVINNHSSIWKRYLDEIEKHSK